MTTEDSREPVLAVTGAVKRFGSLRAVDGVDLELASGELCALLGPSGCGKTTMLRLIAGLEQPDEGEIRLAGRLIAGSGTGVGPQHRGIGMVFQDYALFPHLDAGGNVGYGLGPKPDRERVEQLLASVGLAGQSKRPVHELSGGQQQRVALARALAATPDLILLDEPFSNLDAALRQQMRDEVRSILLEAGVTALFVTHDQEEALSIADRVALMRDGRIVQVGTPEAVYERPEGRWAAEFLGEVELIPASARNGVVSFELGTLSVVGDFTGPAEVMLRPESIAVDSMKPPDARAAVRGTVVSRRFFGHDQLVEVELPSGARIRSRRLGSPAWHPGDRVHVWLDGPAKAMPKRAAEAPA